MGDNFYNPGAQVALASDEVSGKHYQKVKLVYGADDSATDLSASNPLPVSSATSATVGGATPSSTLSAGAAGGDPTVVKASAGQLYGWYISNTNAAVCYVKIYDKATTPTSSDTPKYRLAIPGSTTGGGCNVDFAAGASFANGISFRIVTTAPDNGNTAVAANEVIVNLNYK